MDVLIRSMIAIKVGKLVNLVDIRSQMNFDLKTWKCGWNLRLNFIGAHVTLLEFNFVSMYICTMHIWVHMYMQKLGSDSWTYTWEWPSELTELLKFSIMNRFIIAKFIKRINNFLVSCAHLMIWSIMPSLGSIF